MLFDHLDCFASKKLEPGWCPLVQHNSKAGEQAPVTEPSEWSVLEDWKLLEEPLYTMRQYDIVDVRDEGSL